MSLGVEMLPEKDVRRFSKQIVNAVAYLHGKNIIHCDLKPQNILIDGFWNAKVADFGSAHIYFTEGED